MENLNNNNNNENYKTLYKKELDLKLTKALVLRDYAIESNFDVPDEILYSLEKVQIAFFNEEPFNNSAELDRIIKTLTQLVYPTNFESILIARRSDNEKFDINKFKISLFVISIVFLIVGITSYYLLCEYKTIVKITASTLSISLGALGSLIYIMFNLVGIINESAFNARDTYSNYLRILIGSVLGWIFYFVFAQDSFNDCLSIDKKYLYLFIPFLVGFSTKLVVGILNKSLLAFELVMGIDNKDNDILSRRKNKNLKSNKN